jgi:hypothetical protein
VARHVCEFVCVRVCAYLSLISYLILFGCLDKIRYLISYLLWLIGASLAPLRRVLQLTIVRKRAMVPRHGRRRYEAWPLLPLLLDHARARDDAGRSRVCHNRPPREAYQAPRAASLRAA